MKLSLGVQQTPVDIEQIEALREAYSILNRARGQCASGPNQPYRMVINTQDRIQKEMDELAAPIFADDQA